MSRLPTFWELMDSSDDYNSLASRREYWWSHGLCLLFGFPLLTPFYAALYWNSELQILDLLLLLALGLGSVFLTIVWLATFGNIGFSVAIRRANCLGLPLLFNRMDVQPRGILAGLFGLSIHFWGCAIAFLIVVGEWTVSAISAAIAITPYLACAAFGSWPATQISDPDDRKGRKKR